MQESQHLEFKRLWKDEYLKWVCAFANTDGGTLMLGYNDQGEAVGLKNVDKLLEDIPNKARDVLGILIDVNLITKNNLSNLFTQVEEALEVIKLKYLKASISYGELYRKERFPLPIPALREALLNAVVHKDYASHTAIQISIYPNKLMLWNPGQLPESWTLEKLLSKHESIPYNPDIANAFFRAGLIESWGRGIERIIEACQQDNYPAPQWKLEPNGLWVIFELENTEQQQEVDDSGRFRTILDDSGRY